MKRAAIAVTAAVLALVLGGAVGYLVFGNGNGDGDGDGSPGGLSESAPTDTRCDHGGTGGCVPGAELVLTDDQWRCREPLAEIARQLGGELPLKVTARFTTFVNTSGPVIDLSEGCVGDGSQRIDLILDVQGDGRTRGGTNDAVSVKLDAHDLDITGTIHCGPTAPGGHQDGVQAQGGREIAFVDLEVGDWEAGRATCSGASAGIDISAGGAAATVPTGYRCIRCHVVACRRAINVGESVDVQVTDGRFRSGKGAERREELATGERGLCNFAVSPCNVDATAQGVVFERNRCDEFPYESGRRR